jgi:hypothetical protein
VGIATSTDNLLQNSLGSIPGIRIDCLIVNEIWIEDAGDNLSEEGDGFLMELLRVADIAEGNFIEGIL